MKAVYTLLLFLPFALKAQDSSKVQINFEGFVDVYYTAQEGPVATDNIAFNHSRKNELNINLAIAKIGLNHERYRANVGLMTGTYARYNLAHEPVELRNIWEANAGIRLADKLWLDAGVFSSHMGFESAISSDNLTLTRSFVAENSPYYLSGVNLSYQANDKWSFLLNLSNGWQIINENNSTKALGTQIQFKPNDRFTLNSSTFIGEEPDLFGFNNLRWFHNFWGDFSFGKKLRLITSFDYGQQEDEFVGIGQGTNTRRTWLGEVIILRYAISEKYAIAARQELYADPDGVIIAGDRLQAYSLNLDYSIGKRAMFRMEGKYRFGQTRQATGALVNDELFLVTSLSVRL